MFLLTLLIGKDYTYVHSIFSKSVWIPGSKNVIAGVEIFWLKEIYYISIHAKPNFPFLNRILFDFEIKNLTYIFSNFCQTGTRVLELYFPSISYYFHIPKIFLNFFPHTGKNRNRRKSNLCKNFLR